MFSSLSVRQTYIWLAIVFLFTTQCDSLIMLVVRLNREPGVDPALLAFAVVAYVRVAHRRQFTGGVL